MRGNVWDFWAARYETLWVQRVSLKPTREVVVRNIEPREGVKILDLGCGTGQLFADLREHFGSVGFTYRGVDQSAAMIKVAKSVNPEGVFRVASVMEYDVPDEEFDVIVCSHAFPYRALS